MIAIVRNLVEYRELVAALARKSIVLRYKQAYLGVAWAVLRPMMLMLVFSLVRAFVGIDTGATPYAVMAFSALTIWLFFQDACTEGIGSVVGHASLIRKIYFPREIFPITAIAAKLVEFGIAFALLLGLMAWYGIVPGIQVLWVPVLVVYVILAALAVALIGSSMNVYVRDVSSVAPVLFNLLMYASPIIYPLELVRTKLVVEQAAGQWSTVFYNLYLLNPMAGVIDGFQRALLRNEAPDFAALVPGAILIALLLPVSYLVFKRAEAYFADVV